MVADSVYLTPQEWVDMTTGIDFSDMLTAQKEAVIKSASMRAEAHCNLVEGASWLTTVYVDEQHDWRNTRRVYPYNRPVKSIQAMRLRVGASTVANIPVSAVYLNKTQNYAEVTSLALALGVTPDILSLGLFQSIVEIDYTAGYDKIPQKIKEAVAIIAGAAVVAKKVWEEGNQGALTFTVGSYMTTVAPTRVTKSSGTDPAEPQGAGFANLVPDQAKWLLSAFKFTSLR